jgi:N-acetylmuramoyl-L-alanine amidase
LSKTSAFGLWVSVLVAAGLAASLTVLTAFASDAGAIPNANKATSGTQAASCTGDIVLDPGHGGADSGALNSKYKLTEKDQTLAVANQLKGLLVQGGHTVCMTRTGDQTLSNSDRYTYANTTGAKVLVSIHMNGSTNPATDYTTTLFGKWQKDKELAQTLFKSLSQLTAADGQGTIATRTPYSYASGVLLKSNMPASIAETVFITNDKEGQLLSDGTGNRQQDIAEQLEEGIENYLSTH